MKKIFIYIGSRKEKSNTVKLVELILEKLISCSKEKIEFDIYTANNVIIKNCIGCEQCFYKGECSQEKVDDMGLLKEKMIQADFILLGSPVYANFISADMKCFIDRISSWTHLIRLAGKPAMMVITSNGSGVKETFKYMYLIMAQLGLFMTKGVSENIFSYEQFKDSALIDRCKEYANIINNYLSGKEKIKSTDNLELFFKVKRDNMLKLEKMNDESILQYEYIYWRDNDYLNKKTFKELLESKKLKSK